MQSQLLNDLLNTVDSKIFQLVLQLIIVGAIVLFVKDVSSRVYNFYKLKMSDFGKNIRVKIDGEEGVIRHIGFNEVEIELEENRNMYIPVSRFMSLSKVITVELKKKRSSR